MALLAEELVEEWLNRAGFFTIRGVKIGVHEMDLLAIRPTQDGLECRHVEVQASVNPPIYLFRLTKADQKKASRRGPADSCQRIGGPDKLVQCIFEHRRQQDETRVGSLGSLSGGFDRLPHSDPFLRLVGRTKSPGSPIQIHRVGDAEAMGAVSGGVVREVDAGIEEPVLRQGVVESRRSSAARAG